MYLCHVSHPSLSLATSIVQEVDPPEPEPVVQQSQAPAPSGGRSSPTNGDASGSNTAAPKEVKREENINIHNRVRQQRAQNIFSAPIDLNEEYQTPRYPKSDAAVQFIDSALEDNFIFASLTAKERRLLIDAMMLETVPAGTVIIKQGESTLSLSSSSSQSIRASNSRFLELLINHLFRRCVPCSR
jgi:hypothetical protein